MKNSSKDTDTRNSDILRTLQEVRELRSELLTESQIPQRHLPAIHPAYADSARNLLQYLTLRKRDLRPLQEHLRTLGLASLGLIEPHVLASVDAALKALHSLAGKKGTPSLPDSHHLDFSKGHELLLQHTKNLLGDATPGRPVRIMVTMPSEAANDYTLVHDLLKKGMDCMRINCAHDEPAHWLRMIKHLRKAEKSVGRSCRVVMDLAGPKLRTGPIEPPPIVVKIQPSRDAFGRVQTSARIWLSAQTKPHPAPTPTNASLLVPSKWLRGLKTDDVIKFTDARKARRSFRIVDVTKTGVWAESTSTAYIIPGTIIRKSDHDLKRELREAPVLPITCQESFLTLHQNDILLLTREHVPGRPATLDTDGRILTPASIGCTIPSIFDDIRSGESIWFDDGKIGGIIEELLPTHARVRITHARPKGEKLRADKGINLPDSTLRLSALTPDDLAVLPFVAEHADVVQLSFANSASDVEMLQEHLGTLGNKSPAIVLKIETRRGFENLPDMILTAMRAPSCGVMIARGDLAVECGFERLAEIQEEILWICEAAHVPVIWATQVLETLAKDGLPSRAEISDAAMGQRAECVMLNKGPHVLSAVRVLDDILRRMNDHQSKKRSTMRELKLAHTLTKEQAAT
ncbi:MAG: pyruvate kinase [Verrucomicrobiota bacterium]